MLAPNKEFSDVSQNVGVRDTQSRVLNGGARTVRSSYASVLSRAYSFPKKIKPNAPTRSNDGRAPRGAAAIQRENFSWPYVTQSVSGSEESLNEWPDSDYEQVVPLNRDFYSHEVSGAFAMRPEVESVQHSPTDRVKNLVSSEGLDGYVSIEVGMYNNGVFAKQLTQYVPIGTLVIEFLAWWKHRNEGVVVRVEDCVDGIIMDDGKRASLTILLLGGKRPKKGGLQAKPKSGKGKGKSQVVQTGVAPTYKLAAPIMPRKRAKNKTAGNTSVSMSKCALKFAMSIANPFAPQVRGVCAPYDGAPSNKSHAFYRTDLTFSPSGVIVIFVCPSAVANVPNLIIGSGSTFVPAVGAPFLPWATFGSGAVAATLNAGWSFGQTNAIFNAGSSLRGSNAFKLVSAGLRAQYTGTVMNQSGMYTCLHSPEHTNLSGVTLAELQSFDESEIRAVDRDACLLSMFPVRNSELEFPMADNIHVAAVTDLRRESLNLLYPWMTGVNGWSPTFTSVSHEFPINPIDTNTYVGAPCAAMIVTGVAGSSIHIEYILHYESQGRDSASLETPTESDPVSTEKIICASKEISRAKLANPGKSTWTLLMDEMKSVWREAKPIVVPIAINAALSML